MNYVFQSSDFGALVFGREVLKSYHDATVEFWVGQKTEQKEGISEKTLLEPALKSILKTTRFGRIGIFYDRKNIVAKEFFCKDRFKTCPYEYKPSDKRAEKVPRFYFFEMQVVHEMANEGLADSVEFRRIMRKFLRRAKNAHVNTVFFPEAIFGEEKTKKILQHLSGTQMKVFVSSDFLLCHPELDSGSQKDVKQNITIYTGDNVEFTHARAEKILRTKLKDSDVKRD